MSSSHPALLNDSAMAHVIPIRPLDTSFRLRSAYKKLKKNKACLEAQNRLLLQLSEALGDYNRYLASQKLGRPATDDEAFDHYVLNGGKEHFDHTHPPRG